LTIENRHTCFRPTFENGGYWDYYTDLERQFKEYLEQVPFLTGNEETYSFRLANLILAIGAHIDSAFKETLDYAELREKYPDILSKNRLSISDYCPIVYEYKLMEKKVLFKRLPEPEVVAPFQEFLKTGTRVETPNWWKVYNSIKHHFSDNLEKANLKNTRDALAGAFLLNVFHTPAYIRLIKNRVVKPQRDGAGAAVFGLNGTQWEENVRRFVREDRRIGVVETPLFVFEYRPS
jgi:hypothetical protein